MSEKFIFTDAQIAEVEKLAETRSCLQVARIFGIGETTYHAACKRQPQVREAYERGKDIKRQRYIAKFDEKVFDENDTTLLSLAMRTQVWREKRTIEFNTDEISKLKNTKEITSYIINGLLKSNELTASECLDLVKAISNVQLVDNLESQVNVFDKLSQEQALQLKAWLDVSK